MRPLFRVFDGGGNLRGPKSEIDVDGQVVETSRPSDHFLGQADRSHKLLLFLASDHPIWARN